MGITNPVKLADMENQNSISLTRSLSDKIIAQDANGEIDQHAILENKRKRSTDER